ncbi:hypothetical protein C6Y06_18460 [Bacillus sp. MZGC1]|nr:hypothetical protein C6Y06_18460 [Bacillus sp. MZGC1]
MLIIKITNYIYYVYRTAKFNLIWFKMHLKADINIFENCSWNSYIAHKQNKKDGERHGLSNL